MAKYRVKEIDNTEKFEELAIISHNLRYYSKIWKVRYGSTNLANMKYWETKMDEWLFDNIDYSENDLKDENLPDNCTWTTPLHKVVG